MLQYCRFIASVAFFSIFFTQITTYSFAQTTQWANKVVSYSSFYQQGLFFKEGLSYQEYPAHQVLGKPDVLPSNSGDSPNAWIPAKPDEEEYIVVSFQYPMKVQQIAIAESYHPGVVHQIYCYDEKNQMHLVASLEPKPTKAKGRLYNVFIDPTDYKVTAVKLVLQCDAVAGYNGIDAIGISDASIPINAPINIAEHLNAELVLEKIEANMDNELINLNPIMAPDGKILFFSRKSPLNVGGPRDVEDIWYMEKDSTTGKWKAPINAGLPLNNKGSNFVSAVALDGENYVLLLGNAYMGKNKMKGGVSFSKHTEEGWTQPIPMDIMDFYNFSEDAHYFLSNDQQYLLMAIEREDSFGKSDLYISFNRGNGSWSTPLNLGNINTPDVESSPFLASDLTTLYFSSRGYSGFGEQDVYVTKRLDDSWQKWSEPENLGPVINSAKDDTFFNISVNNDYAFLTRESTDSTNLFQMPLPIFRKPEPVFLVKGQVYNVKNNMPVVANVIFSNTHDSLTVTNTIKTNDKGLFEFKLKPGTYEIFAESQGYTSLNRMKVDLTQLDENEDKIVQRDLYLINEGEFLASTGSIVQELSLNREAIVAEKILFDYDSYALRKGAYAHLDEVAVYLKNNPTFTLKIGGHTSSEGSEVYNKTLSLRRANAVADYLSYKGVGLSQLKTIGFGEEKPLKDNNTASNREKNRRVEFSILDTKKN